LKKVWNILEAARLLSLMIAGFSIASPPIFLLLRETALSHGLKAIIQIMKRTEKGGLERPLNSPIGSNTDI